MSILLHGDCLEEMKGMDDKSTDFIFCDLPYNQTSCKWDQAVLDLEQFWKQIMRIKKLNTPIFMTTTTKFGVSLINSAPKKCPFRYDIVWVKSAPAGFLCAKKMPMRKHEMIYVFYEKLPFYDLSSHKHKFIKERDLAQKKGKIYEGGENKKTMEGKYEPPLPVSVVKEEDKGCYGEKVANSEAKYGQKCSRQYDPPLPVSVVKEEDKGCYGDANRDIEEYKKCGKKGKNQVLYDPPLPVSVVKEDVYNAKERFKNGKLKKHPRKLQKGDDPIYDPPLPVSVVKEEIKEVKTNVYGNVNRDMEDNKELGGRQQRYDPPLPVSVVDVQHDWVKSKENNCYGGVPTENNKECGGHQQRYDPPLPLSVVKQETIYGGACNGKTNADEEYRKMGRKNGESAYDPPLPTTMLEVKSTRGKHSTEKPVALMEWLLKYYSKEGDVVLDPTMGSGSTGVACKNMDRNFVGIEMDEEIYEVACKRVWGD